MSTEERVHTALTFAWKAATDVGKLRSVNEDSYLAAPGMWVIADGMGGHSAGKLASETSIRVFADRAADVPLGLDQVPELLDTANREIRKIREDEGYDVVGTTLCGVVLVDNGGEESLLLFNVGDSRCYETVDGSGMVQRTVDHSYVQELVDRGEITAEDARLHPNRNVVSRAIGLEDSVAADYWILPRHPQSRLLLCSDGLTGEVEDRVIESVLETAESPIEAADTLMGEIAGTPARDNATLIVLDIAWTDEPAPLDDPGDPPEITVERPKPEAAQAETDSSSDVSPEDDGIIDAVPGRRTVDSVKSPSNGPLVDRVPSDIRHKDGE
jgi:PPM family protein phosphatase